MMKLKALFLSKTGKIRKTLSQVANIFLPTLDANAGLVTCWLKITWHCGSCGQGEKDVKRLSSPSSHCDTGWPMCGGCDWVERESYCDPC